MPFCGKRGGEEGCLLEGGQQQKQLERETHPTCQRGGREEGSEGAFKQEYLRLHAKRIIHCK